MAESHSQKLGDTLPPMDTTEIEAVLTEVQMLDPELLESEDTRQLVMLGAQFGREVTERFGTPATPKWASGTHEQEVIMSYHNGGPDGHTSIGPTGAGVPRNALLIAQVVNATASREVYTPVMRAAAFYAAEAHDSQQLCGRTLLSEGWGDGRGDERLSAEAARDRYLITSANPDVARQIYDDVMATAFNPETSAQNVTYEAWRSDPEDPTIVQAILGQELTAAADLLGPSGSRGPLGAIEYSVESLCLIQKGQFLQERLRACGVRPADVQDIEQLFEVIGDDEPLRIAFADTIAGQSVFFANHLRYSDYAIRAACGQGIDDLFPGRLQNATVLSEYVEALRNGETPLTIWRKAHKLAQAV